MKITHNGRIIQVVEYEVEFGGGKKKTFEKARRAPGVRIIIQNKQDEILLSREFRYELNSYDWRLPGSKGVDTLKEYMIFLETGENIEPYVLAAAIREAKEEVGIDIVKQEIIGKKICGATIERDLRYVLVSEFTYSKDGLELEEGELIEGHKRFSHAEISNMIVHDEIQEGRSAAELAKIILS